MNPPDFTLDKIKFATDGPTLEKAVALYESDKITQVEEEGIRSYTEHFTESDTFCKVPLSSRKPG